MPVCAPRYSSLGPKAWVRSEGIFRDERNVILEKDGERENSGEFQSFLYECGAEWDDSFVVEVQVYRTPE